VTEEVRPPAGPSADAPKAVRITRDMLAPAGPPPPDPRGGRIDFERGMSYAPPLTLGLLAFLTAVFVWQVMRGTLESEETITAAGALVRDRVLAGEWWRMITATILHGSPDHLIGNGIILYVLGMATEHAFGARRFAWIYLVSGLGGSALSMAFGPGPSVGASGAIFGVMGALIAYLIRHQDRFYVRDKRIGVVLLAWSVWILIQGLATPFVDNGAHLGGLLAGILCGLVAPSRLLEDAPGRKAVAR
jgi:rhomboid protease GluP